MTSSPTAASRPDVAVRRWLGLALACALVATATDALLLQRSKSFFTGGFLAVDHVDTAGKLFSFLFVSLLSDLAVVGVLAAIGFWMLGGLRPLARASAVAALTLGPIASANFVNYRLVAHLGDAFDLALMFDLTGRRPLELFAVASGHLIGPLLALVAAGCGAIGLAWILHRRGAGGRDGSNAPFRPRHLRAPVLVFLIGFVAVGTASLASDTLENGLRRKPTGRLLIDLANVATDFDRDGYGLVGRFPDPAPFNARIYPYAVDVPGNGIDENGVGGDLPADLPSYVESADGPGAWTHRPDVVLVVLESFRADLVGATYDGRAVTPVLDRLAAQGVSSARAYSHNGYTTQSRHHLFSGSLANLRGPTTLVDDFQANGYEVAWFSGQDESFGSEAFAVGFDRADVAYDARVEPHRRYSTFTTAGSLAVPHTVLLERIEEFLASRVRHQPLFLYVNFHDAHFPYHHREIEPLLTAVVLARREIAPRRADELRAMYANTAANVDAAVGRLLEMVTAAQGVEPAVIVTADHGESLYDEGFLGHGYALNDAQTRIPLVAANLPLVIEEPFGQADLRDAIRGALAEPAAGDPSPRLTSDPSKAIFQYLGNLSRPRQIGLVNDGGRVIYDFRTRQSFEEGAGWQRRDLERPESRRVLEVVHLWERIVLARATREGPVVTTATE